MSEITIKDILAAQVADIKETYGDKVSVFEEVFNFRTSKTLPEGADWPAVTEKVEDEETGEVVEVIKGYKRASFPVSLFRPTAAELAAFLQEGCPEQETILSIVEDFIFGEAQAVISANPGLSTSDFPLDKISFSYLARLPKEVKTRGLDKEEVAAFVADFIEVMPGIIGQSPQWGQLAGSVLEKRFATIKSDRVAQTKMRGYLDIYVSKAPRAEVFATVLSVLVKRLDELLVAEQVNLGDAL